jgi:hypothetical protein
MMSPALIKRNSTQIKMENPQQQLTLRAEVLRQSLPAYTVCAVSHSPYRNVSAHLPNRHRAACIVAKLNWQQIYSF